MKKFKLSALLALILLAAVAFIFIYPTGYGVYTRWYAAAPARLSFLKLAILATFGEKLVARLQRDSYLPSSVSCRRQWSGASSGSLSGSLSGFFQRE